MRNSFFILFTFLSTALFGQVEFDSDSLSNEICACIEQRFESDGETFEALYECMQTSVEKIDHTQLPLNEESELTPYQQGRKFGDSISKVVTEILFENCQVWLAFMHETREAGLVKMREEASKEQLAELESKAREDQTEENDVYLGMAYLTNGQMKKAKKHLEYCIEQYSLTAPIAYFGGLYYEFNDDLHRALKMYEKMYEQYPDFAVLSTVILVRRKIRLQEPDKK